MTTQDVQIVEREVRIDAAPEVVFPFLIDPEKMVRWFGRAATLDPRPGGVYRVDINGSNIASGEFVEIVPNVRVVYTFGWEGADQHVPAGSTTVEIELIPDGDGTLLRLRHRDLPADAAGDHGEGWQHYLARLAIAATGADPGPDSNNM